MSITSFLFQGSAPPNTTTGSSSSTSMPTWLADYARNVLGASAAVGSAPYVPYTGPRIAGPSADTTNAQAMVRNNVGMYQPAISGALNTAASAPGVVGQFGGQGAGMIGQAGDMAMAGANPANGGLAAAAPWLGAASGTYTGNNVNQYMNPYVGNVIDRATQLANRNFNENIMPGLNDQFTSAGQFGSSRHEEMANRAARDLTEGLQSNAASLLSGAYTSGQNAFATDAGRMAGLAGTAGGLGTAGQQAMLSGASTLGGLGNSLAGIGSTLGNSMLSSAGALGSLAQTGQSMNTADAAALDTSGMEQQQQTQQSLDLAYQDFLNQQNWGKTQLGWLQSMLAGTPVTSQSSTSQSVGPASSYAPSPLSQIGSLLSTGLGIYKTGKDAGLWGNSSTPSGTG